MQEARRIFYCGKVLSPNMTRVRCYDRTTYERAVLYRMIESVSVFERFGKTTNFSFGGCMFETRDRLELAAFLELRISTDWGVAVADAAVVFVNDVGVSRFQVGVKFVRLLPDDRSRLYFEMQGRARQILTG